MLKKNYMLIFVVLLTGGLMIGLTTDSIKAFSLNTMKSGWHKLRRAVTGKTILTANNETIEADGAILTVRKSGEKKILLEIPIKKANFGQLWVPSFTKAGLELEKGKYDIYLNTTKCKIIKALPCTIIVYKQSLKAKAMSILGGDPLYHMGDTLNAGLLGDEVLLETIEIPERGIARTYTIFTPSQEIGQNTVRNLDLTKRIIAVKCGSANKDY